MKSHKLTTTDSVYWTLNILRVRRGFETMFDKDVSIASAGKIEDFGDLIKAKIINSELLRIMYDPQK